MVEETGIVAVDGGGTRCRLVYAVGAVRHEVETGCANVSTDLESAAIEIAEGLHRLSQATGLRIEELAQRPAYLGLAGVTGPRMAQEAAHRLPFARCRIDDDRIAALRGALGSQDGAVAHCGTGSFLGVQVSGRTRLAGGWGPRLGDEASAQWVGRRALKAVLDVADGLWQASPMTEALLSEFRDTAGIVAFAGAASPAEFGRYARTVTDAAARADIHAKRILMDGADLLAFALGRTGWVADMPLCLTGGIGPAFAPYLPEPMRAALKPPVGRPIDGAIALAEAFRRELQA